MQFGHLNEHGVGIIMKELVRRALEVIRNTRYKFLVTAKEGYTPDREDLFTSADTEAQRIYLRSLQECFPGYGIIAEEGILSIASTHPDRLFFTVDPLDGTRAFVRRQSHAIGTMLSLCSPDRLLSAYIGDVNTREIFGFRPGSDSVHRISEFNTYETMSFSPRRLKNSYVLLRDPEHMHSPFTQRFIRGAFKNQIVDGGSIGIWLARLWKGEVGAAILPPSTITPWDENPIVAISERMGFVYLRLNHNRGRKWRLCDDSYAPVMSMRQRDYDVLIVHRDNLSEVLG